MNISTLSKTLVATTEFTSSGCRIIQGHLYEVDREIIHYDYDRGTTRTTVETYTLLPEFFCFNDDPDRTVCYFHCFGERNAKRHMAGLCYCVLDPFAKGIENIHSLRGIREVTLEHAESVCSGMEMRFIRKKLYDMDAHDAITGETGHLPFLVPMYKERKRRIINGIYEEYDTWIRFGGKMMYHPSIPGTVFESHPFGVCGAFLKRAKGSRKLIPMNCFRFISQFRNDDLNGYGYDVECSGNAMESFTEPVQAFIGGYDAPDHPERLTEISY